MINVSHQDAALFEAVRELTRVRLSCREKELTAFTRNPTTWELLFIIYIYRDLNISQAIDMIQTKQLSHSSIVRFIQDQISAQRFIVLPGDKRSEKLLSISSELRASLDSYFADLRKWESLQRHTDEQNFINP